LQHLKQYVQIVKSFETEIVVFTQIVCMASKDKRYRSCMDYFHVIFDRVLSLYTFSVCMFN